MLKNKVIAISIPVMLVNLYPAMELTRCIFAYNRKPLDTDSILELITIAIGYLITPFIVYVVLKILGK